jgi:glutamine transport system substrate-binding protein
MRACHFLFIVLAGLATAAQANDLKDIQVRGELRQLGIRYANFVTGNETGLDVEIVRGFAKNLGVGYKLVYTDFDNILPDLLGAAVIREGDSVALQGASPVKGDMIASGFTVLPWREQVVNFSAPTFPTQVWLVARSDSVITPIKGSADIKSDIAETKALLVGKSLLVMEKTCLDPALYGLKGRGIDLRKYTKNTNLNEMVPALLNRDAELTLLDVADVMIDLQKWSGKIKVIGPISEPQVMAYAFPKSSPELRDAFDDYFRTIKANGTYRGLIHKYYKGVEHYFPAMFDGIQ